MINRRHCRHAPNQNFSSEFGYHETNQVASSVYVVIQAFLEVYRRSWTHLRFGIEFGACLRHCLKDSMLRSSYFSFSASQNLDVNLDDEGENSILDDFLVKTQPCSSI